MALVPTYMFDVCFTFVFGTKWDNFKYRSSACYFIAKLRIYIAFSTNFFDFIEDKLRQN